ncbi:MAG: DUF6288 domain-containing protein [Akkermansiaceae bacterium]|nr:DUF6288 domain-containing protein [Akkermansiaceae bacterium]
MKTTTLALYGCLAALMMTGSVLAAEPQGPPDLTQDRGVDRKRTYNLGSTGLRGWIYTKPATYLDSLQGRTTASSRQILVTHVGAKSPADGVVEVDDVILGVGGKPFTDDARKSFAVAIQEAEKEANGGVLKLTCWRAGETKERQLKLRVMGTYADTAPYNCDKSKRIFDEACEALAKEPLQDNWHGVINGLALLATGKAEYLPMIRDFAYKVGPTTLDLQHKTNGSAWDLGYRNMFLSEYYLLTGDKKVRHAINEITLTLARGQGMYGTFGHGFSALTPDGKRHGSVPPYGPVNQAGLSANIGIVMGRKCGLKDPEIDAAIERAAKFFAYFVDKGAIPYGEHEPWPYHDNNGKCAMSAMLFGLQGQRSADAQFFAKMATAAHQSRECGHTGQGFSYLWGALGANVGGPEAVAAFFKEASWHFDLVRRCDGSFTYDGGEQYGAGATDDDTYYGNSSYSGLSPNATYVLTYSLPLKKIFLTGRDADQSIWLSKKEAAAVGASGRFDLDRKKMTAEELVMAFRDWSPIVRGWAAEELAKRPEAKTMEPELIRMAEGPDAHARQGACETLGNLKSQDALPVFVRLLKHDDRWLRYKAAKAIRDMGGEAKPAVPEVLKAVAQTTEPLKPINWADPVQLTHGQLAAALFAGQLKDAVQSSDSKLRYPAIRAVSTNADGMARATLRGFFENQLTVEDVQALAPDILAAVMTPSPADTMFSNEIRMGGFKALTKYNFKEGILAGVQLAKSQGGHGSERRTGEIVKEIVRYGSAAREAIPGLKELIAQFNTECEEGKFPKGELNNMRVGAVEDGIRAIEAATTHPELRSISSARAGSRR